MNIMSTNTDAIGADLELMERGLNKANLNGSYDISEAYLLKTAHNTMTRLLNEVAKSANVLSNTNFDPVNRCVALLASGLRKANKKGCYELEESYVLRLALTNLATWVVDLTREAETLKGSSGSAGQLPTVEEESETNSDQPVVTVE